MKILLVTNKVKTYALGFRNVIEPLQNLGHQVVWAADFSGFTGNLEEIPCKTAQIPINSDPLKLTNLRALKRLKQLIRQEKIGAVQCSTPIGGMLGRLAAKQTGIQKVIYAAHGFLFFEGAPLWNRTVYKWQEQLMARWTDVLITITEEDLRAAQKFKLRSGKKPYFIHGAGVEIGKTVSLDRVQKRRELGVPEDALIMLSAGFLNKNKNNRVLLEAMAKLQDPKLYYVVCGEGDELVTLKNLALKCGVDKNVRFLGYRTDLAELMASSDLFAMPSFREGVPRALLEAMDLGMPCIGSDTRGIRELLQPEFLCKPTDAQGFAAAIQRLMDDGLLREKAGKQNAEAVKPYSAEKVRAELTAIYQEVL